MDDVHGIMRWLPGAPSPRLVKRKKTKVNYMYQNSDITPKTILSLLFGLSLLAVPVAAVQHVY